MDTLDKIVHLLSTQNKTQKDLTDFLKLQKGVFTQWKSGTSQSYKKHIQKIAEFLGTTSAYLLGETNNPNPTDDKEINDNDIKFALFGGDEGITDEMFEDVKKYAEYIKSKKNNKS